MKVVSWNCNSIRARAERLAAYLAKSAADVVCLQELKCTDEELPRDALERAGYHVAAFGQRTYNGVAILSRHGATDVVRGLDDGVEDPQARVLSATVGALRVVCVYAPNGQTVGSPAYEYKLTWYARLRDHLRQRYGPNDPVLVCGDFNVAPEPIDVHDPAEWEGQVLFSAPERDALKSVRDLGLADTFRRHCAEAGKYSWWDYRMLSFPKNRGLRIDHLLASEKVQTVAAGIDREERKGKQPSDHAPVWVQLAPS